MTNGPKVLGQGHNQKPKTQPKVWRKPSEDCDNRTAPLITFKIDYSEWFYYSKKMHTVYVSIAKRCTPLFNTFKAWCNYSSKKTTIMEFMWPKSIALCCQTAKYNINAVTVLSCDGDIYLLRESNIMYKTVSKYERGRGWNNWNSLSLI